MLYSSELDSRIQESEDLLRMLGFSEMPLVPRQEKPKKVMVVPLWEDLCVEASFETLFQEGLIKLENCTNNC